MKTQPAETCLLCDRPLSEVGGSRIVGRSYIGIRFEPDPKANHDKLFIKLDPSCKERFMVVWGPVWTEDMIQRVRQICQQGHHPWFCQECVGPRCYSCGSVTALPASSVILDDEGNVIDVPDQSTPHICSNPKCENYHEH